ncbi:MAG TPA: PspC domain-containing protein [Candidatus Dormibacteraeota bacterium]|nr:PspC domain-containing protein [Candidatus Dormibacteraeota bacterium]
MNCLSCRREIADSSSFCCYCGAHQAPGVAGQRLMRSIMDKKIAGVCSGFADYFGVDPTVMRIIWAFVTLATGIVPGLAAYLVAWFLMPQAPFVAARDAASHAPGPQAR